MKFKAGDLVFCLDSLTQRGNFTGSSPLLVIETKQQDGESWLLMQHLKTGGVGWDFSTHYIKAPSS
jgi:hypothetical protein